MLSISPRQLLGSQSRSLEGRELVTSDDLALGRGKEKEQPKPWKDPVDRHGIFSLTLSLSTNNGFMLWTYWKQSLGKTKSNPVIVYPVYGVKITFGLYSWAHGVTFGEGAVQGQDLDSMVLAGPFQLSISCYSVISYGWVLYIAILVTFNSRGL